MRDLFRQHQGVELVMAARVQLLGRRVERRPMRHYAGRAFATAAGLILGIPVYDTQCGAKLLRATDRTRQLWQTPFLSPWLFDVELLARLCRAHEADTESIHEIAIEYPLPAWRDIAGSKLRAHHLVRVAGDLVRIALHYRASAASTQVHGHRLEARPHHLSGRE